MYTSSLRLRHWHISRPKDELSPFTVVGNLTFAHATSCSRLPSLFQCINAWIKTNCGQSSKKGTRRKPRIKARSRKLHCFSQLARIFHTTRPCPWLLAVSFLRPCLVVVGYLPIEEDSRSLWISLILRSASTCNS